MDIYEDSMPFRFTPDGLDETSIDALIAEAYGEVDDVPEPRPAATADRRPAGHRPVQRSSRDQAA